jgi:hypothetical protein
VIEQWNGTKWSLFPGPKFGKKDRANVFAMTSSSANDVWAIGSLVNFGTGLVSSLFEHWNGTAWTATTLELNNQFLFGASADAANDTWAVGFNGSDKIDTSAMPWDGANWTSVATPNVGEGTNKLNAVLALAPNDVWAVGFSTPVAPPKPAATLTLIEHFDGTSWTVVPSPNIGPNSANQSNRLLGLTANSANDIWAFGSYFPAQGQGTPSPASPQPTSDEDVHGTSGPEKVAGTSNDRLFFTLPNFLNPAKWGPRRAAHPRAEIQGGIPKFLRLCSNSVVRLAVGHKPSRKQRTWLWSRRERLRKAERIGIRGWHHRNFHDKRDSSVTPASGSPLFPVERRWIRAPDRLCGQPNLCHPYRFRPSTIQLL